MIRAAFVVELDVGLLLHAVEVLVEALEEFREELARVLLVVTRKGRAEATQNLNFG